MPVMVTGLWSITSFLMCEVKQCTLQSYISLVGDTVEMIMVFIMPLVLPVLQHYLWLRNFQCPLLFIVTKPCNVISNLWLVLKWLIWIFWGHMTICGTWLGACLGLVSSSWVKDHIYPRITWPFVGLLSASAAACAVHVASYRGWSFSRHALHQGCGFQWSRNFQ